MDQTGNLRRSRVRYISEDSHDKQPEYTFEYFTETLRQLRSDAEDILKAVTPEKLGTSKANSYKECVHNFQERLKFLDNFDKDIKIKRNSLEEEIKNLRGQPKEKAELRLKEGKLQNLKLLADSVLAERQREEFYKRTVVEKYMENCLEVTVS